MDNSEIDKELEICVPKSTRYKSDWAVAVFERWRVERRQRAMNCNLVIPRACLVESIFEMDVGNVIKALKLFLFEARKQEGNPYPSHTLYGLFTYLQAAIRAKGKKINMFEDKVFEDSRRCLDAVMRKRSAEGLGAACRKQTETITCNEEGQLWKSGALGEETPRQLLDTVLYLIGLHFALRCGKEHRSLRMFENPQITGPFTDQNERRYLCTQRMCQRLIQRLKKQRKQARKKVRAYENPERLDRCYVRIFEKYKSPCKDGHTTSIFYFTPLSKPKDGKWYLQTPVGHNTLQGTVKHLCSEAAWMAQKLTIPSEPPLLQGFSKPTSMSR